MDNKYRIAIFGLSLFLSCLFFLPSLSNSDVILIAPGIDEIYLGPNLEYLEDKNGLLTIDDVAKNSLNLRFHKCNELTPGFGFTSSTYWFRFTLKNSINKPISRYLEIEYPLLDYIEFFVPDSSGGFRHYKEGDHLAFKHRPILYRNFVFKLDIPPQKELTYFMKIRTSSSLNIPARIYSESRFIDKIENEETALGMYFGILFAMLVYNLILFFTIRESVYFYYVAFVISNFLFQISLTGVAFKYFWPNSIIWANKSVPFFIFLAYLFGTTFTRAILSCQKNAPFFDNLLKYLSVFAIFGAIVSLFFPYEICIKLATLTATTVVVHIIAGFLCLFRGYRPARYYALAWGVSLAGIAIYALKSFSILPNNFFTIWGLQIGSAWEVIFLSMALTDRLNLLQKEKDRIQAEYTKKLEKARQDLEDFARTLEQKVKQRTLELQRSNLLLKKQAEEMRLAEEKAEMASKAKSEFLANMSHEIRTPLNAITGITAVALEMELPEKLRQYLKVIRASANSLLNLVNDILDFSKIEAGKMELEEVDFNLLDVLENIADMFAEIVSEKNIDFIIDLDQKVPLGLVGDPVRLGQLLTNFVSNAIKFTEKGQVVLRVSALEEKGNRCTIIFKVLDTGIGIEKDRLKDLFDMFTQADSSTTRRFGGTGLGLTICKRIAELMDGEIGVESTLGIGSIFSFKVTLKKIEDADEKRKDILIDKTPSFMIITDNKDQFIAIKHAIRRWIPSADIANRIGFQEIIKKEEALCGPDIVLLDMNRNELDNINSYFAYISNKPAILLAPFGLEDYLFKAVAGENFTIIRKPVRERELINSIFSVLSLTPPFLYAHSKKKDLYLKGARILVVEDNEINQTVAKEILSKFEADIDFAFNGQEALDMLSKGYDLIFMDIQMPVMDGYEAAKQIRRNPNYKTLPIIAMTASVFKEDKQRCFEAGMNDFVMKPITPEALSNVLKKWIAPEKIAYRDIKEKTSQEEGISRLTVPGLNLNVINERFAGNDKLLFELIKKFVKDYDDISSINTSQDPEKLKKYFHTMKGVASNLGLESIYSLCIKIENSLLKAKDFSVHLEHLKKEFIKIKKALSAETGRGEVEEESKITDSQTDNNLHIKNLFFKLDELLELNDIECEDFWLEIKDKIADKVEAQLLQEIESLIQDFEFEQARKKLSLIRARF